MAVLRPPRASLAAPWAMPSATAVVPEVVVASPTVQRSEAERRVLLGQMYEAHAARIHRFLRDLLADSALASDATQETFVRAFRQLGTLRDEAKALAWLFGIARNVSLELRKARFRSRRVIACDLDDASTAVPPEVGAASPETELLDLEALRVVEGALAELGEDRRAVLLLRLDHGLAYGEIAEAMGWSLAKVKVEIHRAREVLRAALARYEGGADRHG